MKLRKDCKHCGRKDALRLQPENPRSKERKVKDWRCRFCNRRADCLTTR